MKKFLVILTIAILMTIAQNKIIQFLIQSSNPESTFSQGIILLVPLISMILAAIIGVKLKTYKKQKTQL